MPSIHSSDLIQHSPNPTSNASPIRKEHDDDPDDQLAGVSTRPLACPRVKVEPRRVRERKARAAIFDVKLPCRQREPGKRCPCGTGSSEAAAGGPCTVASGKNHVEIVLLE